MKTKFYGITFNCKPVYIGEFETYDEADEVATAAANGSGTDVNILIDKKTFMELVINSLELISAESKVPPKTT
jgi:hypothetical protein